MNKINPVKINSAVQEISSKKEVIKETAQQAVQEIKTQASNLGRDLVKTANDIKPNISLSELIKDGYSIGASGIVFKMDDQLYKSVKFNKGKVTNITIEDTYTRKQAVISEKLNNGKWVSIVNRGQSHKIIDENTSERAVQKATELQFDGYKITAQDEKSLTLIKDDLTVNLSKANGKEIK